MKVPVSWLKSLVDFNEATTILADKLTFAGLEVEAIEKIGSNFDGIVVGEILEITNHPNADKLNLCLVNYGEEGPIRVVCGAPNVEIGGKYPFAPVGTTLPGGFTLKKAKIRGEVSMGMLCAKDELGLGSDHSGLMELDKTIEPGTLFVDVWGEPNEVIELEITPNRPDCLSVIGVARELAALYKSTLNIPVINLPKSDNLELKIHVENKQLCPRYTGRIIKDVKIGPSPKWMQERLQLVGISPINNVVDITNYVMIETGHPMHAFDIQSFKDNEVIIRNANKGEYFTALDKTEHKLSEDMLVIANKKEPVALAGIIGGSNSEIKENTSTIILEVASFNKTSIRSSAKKSALATDASYRFQRGICIQSVLNASDRATELILKYAEAKSFGEVVDVYESPCCETKINIIWDNIISKIGVLIPVSDMKDILNRLSVKIINDNGVSAEAIIPQYRLDLEREIDLVEEIARVYGVNNIPDNLPSVKVIPGTNNSKSNAITIMRGLLQGLGISEIMNYTLVNHTLLDLFNLEEKEEREELPHPISMDQSVLRSSLIPQLVESFGRNNSRQIHEACFYEIGKVFKRINKQVIEQEYVSIGIMGPSGRMPLDKSSRISNEEQFLWIKGIIEELFYRLGLTSPTFSQLSLKAFEENQAVKILINDVEIGVMGLIAEELKKEWRFNTPIAVAELSILELLEGIGKIKPVEDIPIYPSISRDVALIVGQEVSHESVMLLVDKFKPKALESVELFDVYKGSGVEKGKKSIAYNFIYRSLTDTLTDKRVNKVHEKLTNILCQELPAEIRV